MKKRTSKAKTPEEANKKKAHIEAVFQATHFIKPSLEPLIEEPLANILWTKNLPGYAEARKSGLDALHRLWAATEAGQTMLSSAGWVDGFLLELKAGTRSWNDPAIPQFLAVAQKLGRVSIFEELARAQENFQKRVDRSYGGFDLRGVIVADLNFFRAALATKWMCYAFWLMSDDLIASMINTAKMKPDGCNRQTISEAVRQMGLEKGPGKPLIRNIGVGGVFEFASGYPPAQ